MADFSHLRPFATSASQIKVLDALEKGMSQRAVAAECGVVLSRVTNILALLRQRAALQGVAPDHDMTRPVPAPYFVKGVSTYYDKEGKAAGQWVKSAISDVAREQAIRDFVLDLAEGARGKSPAVRPPKTTVADILCAYPVGDPHFGMYAWKDEAGDDFDLDKAERLMCGAVDRLIQSAPRSRTALLIELGDLLHADNRSNMTERSGNVLDVDTRWPKVMQVALRAMRYSVERLLTHHENVIVRLVPGNHDPHSAFALALALHAYFDNNQRVLVDMSPSWFWYYRFGRVLIGATHGDTAKPADLPSIMSVDRAQDWGATTHRYFYHGHIHHAQLKEHRGCIVESFRTLASSDAWHHASGYRSGRDMHCIVHHKKHGEIERHRCDAGMIGARS